LNKTNILFVIIQKSPLSAAADSEHRKVCDIPSMNSEAINFRKRRKEFRKKENMNMNQCVKGGTSSYARRAFFNIRKHRHICNERGAKKRLKQRAATFCSIQSCLLASGDVMEFQTTEDHNSIHFYLRANLTARRPITKYARETTKILQ
jgi:hypothetical protein